MVVLLWMSVLLPISDTLSDWLVTLSLLGSSDPTMNSFGVTSLVLIVLANSAQAAFFTWWESDPEHAEHAQFHPLVGFMLTMSNLRLPVTAFIDSCQILLYGISPDDTKAPKHQAMNKIFTGGSNIIFLKVFEIMFETVRQPPLPSQQPQLTVNLALLTAYSLHLRSLSCCWRLTLRRSSISFKIKKRARWTRISLWRSASACSRSRLASPPPIRATKSSNPRSRWPFSLPS